MALQALRAENQAAVQLVCAKMQYSKGLLYYFSVRLELGWKWGKRIDQPLCTARRNDHEKKKRLSLVLNEAVIMRNFIYLFLIFMLVNNHDFVWFLGKQHIRLQYSNLQFINGAILWKVNCCHLIDESGQTKGR